MNNDEIMKNNDAIMRKYKGNNEEIRMDKEKIKRK